MLSSRVELSLPTDGLPVPDQDAECADPVVCHCLQIRESTLIQTLRGGNIRTVKDICRQTGAGDGCTACHALLRWYIEKHG
jgi:bacterioferritin-associated ferredoxin